MCYCEGELDSVAKGGVSGEENSRNIGWDLISGKGQEQIRGKHSAVHGIV